MKILLIVALLAITAMCYAQETSKVPNHKFKKPDTVFAYLLVAQDNKNLLGNIDYYNSSIPVSENKLRRYDIQPIWVYGYRVAFKGKIEYFYSDETKINNKVLISIDDK